MRISDLSLAEAFRAVGLVASVHFHVGRASLRGVISSSDEVISTADRFAEYIAHGTGPRRK